MVGLFFRLLLLLLLIYGAIPYYALYRMDHALVVNDHQVMQRYIDLEQIQQHYKERLRIEQGRQGDVLSRMFRSTANSMSELTVNQVVTMDWVRYQLSGAESQQVGQSLFPRLDHAFFEGIDTFVVRVGKLGHDPLHLKMTREGVVWRLSAIYH